MVVVSWKGNLLEHCTCSVTKGVLGECLKNEKRSTRHAAFETAYNKQRHNNKLFKGAILMVRQKLTELNDLGACLWGKKDCDAIVNNNEVSYRLAKIQRFHHKNSIKFFTRGA